ncbi:hypothetical protein U0070_022631 [Myodes glareolus]|uniref:Uncharacterized protein n=1 Tax=Myodes glareolus TaxID=447135 RepID=A0AAW0HAX0_MYOGA
MAWTPLIFIVPSQCTDKCPETSIENPEISSTQEYFSSSVMVSRAVQTDLTMPVLESLEKEQVVLVARALKWSSGGSGKLGHPRFHQSLKLWGLQYYCKSQYYFLPSIEGKDCTNMTDRYSTTHDF